MKIGSAEGTEILNVMGGSVHICTNGESYTIGMATPIDFEFKEIDKKTYEALKKLENKKGEGLRR